MFIIGLLSSSEAHIEAVKLILTGPYGASFWVILVGLGIVVPLFLQSLAVRDKIKHTPVPPLLVLLGGLALRFIIVYAGQYSHYLNAHFK
ncbi:MAG: NrfD/PsrC family molybdoenzyme membrane anchor subunit, partial [Syntrophothermus sp.]